MIKGLVLAVAFLFVSSNSYGQTVPFPFPYSEKLAERVVNLVVFKANPVRVQWSSFQDGYESYQVRSYDGFKIYNSEVKIYRNGSMTMKIDFYLTNRDFSSANPGDNIADELMWGRPEIIQEIHIFDRGITGEPAVFQTFNRYSHGVWHGFTREERDLGKKVGVQEYQYMDGRIWQERKFRRDRWLEATKQEKDELWSWYVENLVEIEKLLK